MISTTSNSGVRRRRRPWVGLLALSMSVTGCIGTGQEALVNDPDLTKQTAIEQTLEYLEHTEAALPEGMALSINSDAPGAVPQEGPTSGGLSCNSSDGGSLETDPQLVWMFYFVTGVPEGQTKKYVTQIRRLWESWGWKLTKEPTEQRAAYVNEDGYGLDVQVSNLGTISVGGETPCIAAENFTGGDAVPQQIGGGGS